MLIFGMMVVTLCCAVTYAQNAPEASERGKEVYEQSCAHCHGTEGRGDGSAAENLLPKPRDFTRGLYKIRSTEAGELPTDQESVRYYYHRNARFVDARVGNLPKC